MNPCSKWLVPLGVLGAGFLGMPFGEAAHAQPGFGTQQSAPDPRLRTVVERTSRLGNLGRVGRTEEVLVQGPSRKDPSRLTGRTRQNRLVHFDPTGAVRPGSYVSVEIIDATTTHLRGHMVELLVAPSHRVRIPVAAE